MPRRKVVGKRRRKFKVRNEHVPEAVHTIMEFVYDVCLELGICPMCKLRELYVNPENRKVYSKCYECLRWMRAYYKRRRG